MSTPFRWDGNVIFRKGYMGNSRLKPPGVKIDFTPEQTIEWIKCSEDPIYFIENYVKIVQADKGIIPFDMWDFQKEFVEKIHENRWVLAKMSRQIGKTVSTTSYLLWYIIFNKTKTVAVMSNKLEGAVKVLRQLKQSYELLPLWLQQGVVKWAERSIILENGSRAFTSGTTAAGIRGETVNIIYCDEFAFVPHNIQLQFYESIYPTISSGDETKIVITSTPKGLEMFYKLWRESEQHKNFFTRAEGYWHQVPGRGEKWKREQIANIGEQQFLQEFDAHFMGSAATLIHGPKLATLVAETAVATSDSENLQIFEYPMKGHTYAMTVDVAQGVGGDYSAFSIIDITAMPYSVVATYYNNTIQPMQFPEVIYRVAKQFNDAAVLIELNDNGDQVANILHYDFEYEHIFMTEVEKAGLQTISGGFGKRTQMGVKMTKQVKRTGCSTLKTLVEMDKLLVNDQRTLNELANFVETGSTHKAAPGHHDDLTMTLVIFAWLTLQPYFKELTESDTERNVRLDSQRMFEQELTPFGDVITGLDSPNFREPVTIGDEWERKFNEQFYGSETALDHSFFDDLRAKYLRDDKF